MFIPTATPPGNWPHCQLPLPAELPTSFKAARLGLQQTHLWETCSGRKQLTFGLAVQQKETCLKMYQPCIEIVLTCLKMCQLIQNNI